MYSWLIKTMQFLEAIDPGLSNYLVEIEAKLGNFYWQAWTNLYTDLLPRSDWLILFDHLVCFPEYIELFPIVIATELSLQREALMSCPDRMTLEAVLEQVKIENIKVTLSRTIDLLAACSKLPGFEYPFKKTIPLTKEIYQAFSFLPKSLTQAKY
jgi:hypothetical protein